MFLTLLAEVDLRDFVVVKPFHFQEPWLFIKALEHFVACGILERGPRIHRSYSYRIAPQFLYSMDAVRRQDEKFKARAERETMMWRSYNIVALGRKLK